MKKILLSIVLSLGIAASFAANTISNVSFSSPLTPGEEATVTFDYTFDNAGFLRIVFGKSVDATTNDFINWSDAVSAVNSWGSVKELEAGTFTGVTATFTVPASTTSSTTAQADDYEMRAAISLRQDGVTDDLASTWLTTNISAAASTGSLTNVVIPESAEIGSEIDVIVTYSHDFPNAKAVKLFLLKTDANGIVSWDESTYGYAEAMLAAGQNQESSIKFMVKAKNDDDLVTVTSSALATGKLWKIVAQFNEVNTSKTITLVTAEVEATNLVSNAKITSAETNNEVKIGKGLDVMFDYQVAQDSRFEVSVVKFKDGVAVDPKVVVSTVKLSSALVTKSTTVNNTASEKFSLTINENAVATAKLPAGETYKVVVNVLDGTTDAVITSFNFAVTVNTVAGLFDFSQVALLDAFPNPSSDKVNFTQRLTNVVVLDATGTIVEKLASATELNVVSYKSGLYMIKADQGTAKVLVK